MTTPGFRRSMLTLVVASCMWGFDNDSDAVQPPGLPDLNAMWSQGRAKGKGPVRFTHSPMRVEDIEHITPLGLVIGGHVTPIDHQYYYPKALKPGSEHFDVRAPADGFLVRIGHRVKLFGSSEKGREYDDYALIIEHSSTFYTHYDLLTKLDKTILDKLDAATREKFEKKAGGPPQLVRIPVKAGQVVGKVGGRSLDFGALNTEVVLKGVLTPSLYGHYAWRVYTVDPFDYFDEPLKGQLLKLNPRKAAPLGGKIDHDIDGKLAGNWFREGTQGYAGNRDPRGYWMGHLALVYHHIDPSVIIVSLGDFAGQPRQFAVQGNGPDPARVGKADGMVKFELIWSKLSSSGKVIQPKDTKVQGVLLVEMLADRRIRVEAFPGKTAREVTGFTKNAALYER